MNYKLIDLGDVTTKDELFHRFEDGLDLPIYFGKNLDALHDMLAHSNLILEIHGFDKMKDSLGDYADAFREVLRDAEEESKNFRAIIR